MFGDGDTVDAKTRLALLRRQVSLLDFVAEDAKRLSGNLGAADKRKMVCDNAARLYGFSR